MDRIIISLLVFVRATFMARLYLTKPAWCLAMKAHDYNEEADANYTFAGWIAALIAFFALALAIMNIIATLSN